MAWGSATQRDVVLEYERARGLSRAGSWCALESGGRLSWQAGELAAASGGGLVAQLCKFSGARGSLPPVLLVHGASAWRGTFMEQDGGLLRHLLRSRDVWTLDWRASKVITDRWRDVAPDAVPEDVRNMNLDLPAVRELPAAIEKVRDECGQTPDVLGHCMGAAIVAIALARGTLASTPRRVVLSALGLFYRGTVDTWFRADERLDAHALAPNGPWYLDFASAADLPEPYQRAFELWRKTPYLHCQVPFCQRISAILGCPYRPDDIGYLHDVATHEGLATQFGVMPTGILNHCARNVRRGWSAPYAGSRSVDRTDLQHPERFAQIDKLTLITGAENQLWHRDSIDRMYEWLNRAPVWRRERQAVARLEKRVFDRFGHQDLFLSPLAAAAGSVYDYVLQRLS